MVAPAGKMQAEMALRALAAMVVEAVVALEVMAECRGSLGMTTAAATMPATRVVAVLAGVSLFSGKTPPHLGII